MNKSIVIIPTYNEIDNIEDLIRQILNLNRELDILVIDDNSPDGTGRLLDNLSGRFGELKLIHRHKKMGLGSAYMKGFEHVLCNGYEYIICMDGDLSHNPAYINHFLDKIKDCDLVLGSRFLNGIHIINWSFFRLFLSLSAIKYVKLITGISFSDPQGGFRCFRRQVIQRIVADGIISKGYLFQTELLYRTYKMGWKIEEVPIFFIDRRLGKSKLSLGIILEALFKILIVRFKFRNLKK